MISERKTFVLSSDCFDNVFSLFKVKMGSDLELK